MHRQSSKGSGWLGWSTAAAAALALCGCAGLSPGGAPGAGDPEPLYKVENRPGGFTISTVHSRRNTARGPVEDACRRGLVGSANDLARSLGRTLQPVDGRSARVRMSEDTASDTTRCEGSLAVSWAS